MKMLWAIIGRGQKRRIQSPLRHVPAALGVITAVWSIYQSIWSTLDVVSLTIVFLSLTIALTFLTYTPTNQSDTARASIIDLVLATLSLLGGVYFISKIDEIAVRISLFDPLTTWDIAFATMFLLMLLESVRRTIGISMCVIVILLFGYNLYGNYLPGFLQQQGIGYLHYLDVAFFTTDGVFGTPLRVAATYGFLFVIFGTLLHRCGAGDFFYNLASSTGRRPGGPAKIAVVSSGLFGSTSGNPVADVVTTGSITIPIMVRTGIAPKEAAGIEATASTGGTLMPPVMGAAAFIMAEFTGIPYNHIAAAALIPVFLYYCSLYIQVHLHAMYNDLMGSDEEYVRLLDVLKKDFLFAIPIVALIVVLAQGYSPSMVAFVGIIAVIATATLRASTRMNLRVIYEQLAESAERVLPVAMACAAAGLVMGGITMTGLANKFGHLIEFTSGGDIWLALCTAAVITIILGMGLPTSASYILASVLIAGILERFGLATIQAHMFLLYFAAISAITPPIAIASFAAAAIANSDPLTTSIAALRRGIVLLIIPFAFAAHGPLLMQGVFLEIVLATFFALIGVIGLSGAVEKYLLGRLLLLERWCLLSGGLMLLLLPIEWQLIGLALTGAGIVRNAVMIVIGRRASDSWVDKENHKTVCGLRER